MARLKRFAPLLLLLAGAVAVFASGAGQYLNLDALQSHEAALRAFVAQQLPLALLAFIAVYALALTRLGHPSVAVYDGSMSEWTRDPDLPMETGT